MATSDANGNLHARDGKFTEKGQDPSGKPLPDEAAKFGPYFDTIRDARTALEAGELTTDQFDAYDRAVNKIYRSTETGDYDMERRILAINAMDEVFAEYLFDKHAEGTSIPVAAKMVLFKKAKELGCEFESEGIETEYEGLVEFYEAMQRS